MKGEDKKVKLILQLPKSSLKMHPPISKIPGGNSLAAKQSDDLLVRVVGEELPLWHRLVNQTPLPWANWAHRLLPWAQQSLPWAHRALQALSFEPHRAQCRWPQHPQQQDIEEDCGKVRHGRASRSKPGGHDWPSSSFSNPCYSGLKVGGELVYCRFSGFSGHDDSPKAKVSHIHNVLTPWDCLFTALTMLIVLTPRHFFITVLTI